MAARKLNIESAPEAWHKKVANDRKAMMRYANCVGIRKKNLELLLDNYAQTVHNRALASMRWSDSELNFPW
jgi:hypothetical protein